MKKKHQNLTCEHLSLPTCTVHLSAHAVSLHLPRAGDTGYDCLSAETSVPTHLQIKTRWMLRICEVLKTPHQHCFGLIANLWHIIHSVESKCPPSFHRCWANGPFHVVAFWHGAGSRTLCPTRTPTVAVPLISPLHCVVYTSTFILPWAKQATCLFFTCKMFKILDFSVLLMHEPERWFGARR